LILPLTIMIWWLYLINAKVCNLKKEAPDTEEDIVLSEPYQS